MRMLGWPRLWPALLMATGMLLPLGFGPRSARAQQFYDNVVIVLDASGSMGQPMRDQRTQKMVAAREAIKAVLKTVPPTTRIGLLVFSAENLRQVVNVRFLSDVARDYAGGAEFLGQLLDGVLLTFALVGEDEVGAFAAESAGDGVGERPAIGQTENERGLVFQGIRNEFFIVAWRTKAASRDKTVTCI